MANSLKRVALLIVPTTGYFADVIAGVQEYAASHGDWLIEICSDPRAADAMLHDWHPDAVMFDSHLFSNWLPVLEERQLPRVQIGGLSNVDAATVSVDNVAIGRIAAEHFLALGHRHFGFCGYSAIDWSLERRDGYIETLSSRGMESAEFLDDDLCLDIGSTRDDLPKWLNSLPKPVAVFACHDRRAALVARASERAGLEVPDQVAILGVDDDPLYCLRSNPPLSSVMGAAQRVGYEASLILEDLIQGATGPKQPQLVPPVGVSVRVSSDALATEDPHLAAAIKYIDEHIDTAMTVNDVAEAAFTSRRRLERLFRSQLHCSPRERIVRMRVEHAKRLLTRTDKSLLAVALDCGFPSASKFSTVFRRHVGLTPIEFRRRF